MHVINSLYQSKETHRPVVTHTHPGSNHRQIKYGESRIHVHACFLDTAYTFYAKCTLSFGTALI